jgi:hypothetical protein
VIKRFLAILCFAFVLSAANFCCAPLKNARAQTVNWVRVVNNETWFYKNPSSAESDKMFVLCYSYYLKVVSDYNQGYYAVELMENSDGFVKIYGFVSKSAVKEIYVEPLLPLYPAESINVHNADAVLYTLPASSSSPVCGAFKGHTLYYYGSYPISGEMWYFVRYGANLCYVHKNAVTTPNIVPHPTPVTVPENPDTAKPDPNEKDDLADLQIALIVLISVPSIIIVAVLFLPTKSKKQNFLDASQEKNKPVSPDKKNTRIKPRYFDDYL